jgi:Mg-chelatase subunit ChlD
VRAAWRLRGTGEVERAREALEAFDTAGADGLTAAIRAWRRAVGR